MLFCGAIYEARDGSSAAGGPHHALSATVPYSERRPVAGQCPDLWRWRGRFAPAPGLASWVLASRAHCPHARAAAALISHPPEWLCSRSQDETHSSPRNRQPTCRRCFRPLPSEQPPGVLYPRRSMTRQGPKDGILGLNLEAEVDRSIGRLRVVAEPRATRLDQI